MCGTERGFGVELREVEQRGFWCRTEAFSVWNLEGNGTEGFIC